MDSSSVNKVERQDTETSAAALPHSDQPPVPTPKPLISPQILKSTAVEKCHHDVSEFLLAKLPTSKLCPRCKFFNIVRKIKVAQRRLTERGGVFASWEIGTGHQEVKELWHVPKVHLMNAVAEFEALLADPEIPERDCHKLERLVDAWNRIRDDLAKVPGVREVPTVKEPSQEEHEVARLMIELLRLVLEKETTAEDKKHIQPGVRAVLGPYTHPFTPKPASLSASARITAPPPPKSILKIKLSSSLTRSPETPQSKRIRITDTVTISPPRLNIINPCPFTKLSAEPTVQTHAAHTVAENHRPRPAFQRKRSAFKRGVWASGPGEEKVNTSFHGRSWEHAEKVAFREAVEDNEEKKVVEKLKTITAAWVGFWWIRGVVVHGGVDFVVRNMVSKWKLN